MEIKVKDIGLQEEKSKAEIEQELLEKHEEKFDVQDSSTEKVEVETKEESKEEVKDKVEEPVKEEEEKETPSSELSDEDVLTYIKNRYDKEINSVDDLLAEKETAPELPEDVSMYLKYKQETGRGISDFYNTQRDFDTMDDDSLLAEFIAQNEEGLDAIDIQDIMEDKFGFDEELDDPKDIKRKKLSKKRELAKARKFLTEQKDKYKVPLESSRDGLSADQQENLNAYKKYIDESKTIQEAADKRYDYFLNKTKEVFTNEFKGFDFTLGENKFTYKPGTSDELINTQSDINNFIKKYTDEKGLMKDASGYHKALAVAMNPEKFAQYFYDQGVSSAVDNVAKKSKNINMDVRQSPQVTIKDGRKIRSIGSQSSGRGLRIKSIKKS
jgi:hypothetical protein|tara:strand:- start:1288 stop:2439 length:1152 start_codon:yes stop_codon:yes gene_type:complete